MERATGWLLRSRRYGRAPVLHPGHTFEKGGSSARRSCLRFGRWRVERGAAVRVSLSLDPSRTRTQKSLARPAGFVQLGPVARRHTAAFLAMVEHRPLPLLLVDVRRWPPRPICSARGGSGTGSRALSRLLGSQQLDRQRWRRALGRLPDRLVQRLLRPYLKGTVPERLPSIGPPDRLYDCVEFPQIHSVAAVAIEGSQQPVSYIPLLVHTEHIERHPQLARRDCSGRVALERIEGRLERRVNRALLPSRLHRRPLELGDQISKVEQPEGQAGVGFVGRDPLGHPRVVPSRGTAVQPERPKGRVELAGRDGAGARSVEPGKCRPDARVDPHELFLGGLPRRGRTLPFRLCCERRTDEPLAEVATRPPPSEVSTRSPSPVARTCPPPACRDGVAEAAGAGALPPVASAVAVFSVLPPAAGWAAPAAGAALAVTFPLAEPVSAFVSVPPCTGAGVARCTAAGFCASCGPGLGCCFCCEELGGASSVYNSLSTSYRSSPGAPRQPSDGVGLATATAAGALATGLTVSEAGAGAAPKPCASGDLWVVVVPNTPEAGLALPPAVAQGRHLWHWDWDCRRPIFLLVGPPRLLVGWCGRVGIVVVGFALVGIFLLKIVRVHFERLAGRFNLDCTPVLTGIVPQHSADLPVKLLTPQPEQYDVLANQVGHGTEPPTIGANGTSAPGVRLQERGGGREQRQQDALVESITVAKGAKISARQRRRHARHMCQRQPGRGSGIQAGSPKPARVSSSHPGRISAGPGGWGGRREL
eukprot:scaffold1354_cov111-Isochrysis_galbana.AAC.3